MNVGEYGIAYNLNVNYNISGFTSLNLTITRPDGTVITRNSPDVTAPATPLVAGEPYGTFFASQYARYVFQAGDLNQAGQYTARLTYTDASKRLVSDLGEDAMFTVNA